MEKTQIYGLVNYYNANNLSTTIYIKDFFSHFRTLSISSSQRLFLLIKIIIILNFIGFFNKDSDKQRPEDIGILGFGGHLII